MFKKKKKKGHLRKWKWKGRPQTEKKYLYNI